jgi:PiT family inorganic phosphate transporter
MDLGTVSLSLILLIALALAFDFMNGFHDAANSIATVVSTGVLKPWQAVLWAAFFNVVAVFFFHLGVAATVGKGIVDPGFVDNQLIFGALIGAIAWNLITWYYGIPSSSSHALIGGLIGAALAKAGTEPLLAPGIIKTAAFIFISPMAGMVFGAGIMLAVSWLFFGRRRGAWTNGSGGCSSSLQRPTAWVTAPTMRRKPWASSGCCSSPMGSPPRITCQPGWCSAASSPFGFGTMFGGWRIVKTMGQRITKLKPVGGFAAECAGSIALFMATYFSIPVSTTHTITGAIIGVGTTRGTSAVRWGVAGNIVIAWIVTIPASAGIAAIAWWFGGLIF